MDLSIKLLAVVVNTHVAFLLIQLDRLRGVRVLLGHPHLIHLGERLPNLTGELLPNLTQLKPDLKTLQLAAGQAPALTNQTQVLGTVLHPLLLSQWLILLAVATSTIENSPLSTKLRHTPQNKALTILIKEDKK